jgi:hypothetical protein
VTATNSQVRLVVNSSAPVHESTTLVFQSMKSKIANALTTICKTIPRVKYTSFDKIKLLASDFQDHEIPAIQLIDVGLTSEHVQARAKKTWQISLELLLRQDQYNQISNNTLWDFENEVLRAIWANPNLGIPGVVHPVFLGSHVDLHLIAPMYYSRLDFQVVFFEDLVRHV